MFLDLFVDFQTCISFHLFSFILSGRSSFGFRETVLRYISLTHVLYLFYLCRY